MAKNTEENLKNIHTILKTIFDALFEKRVHTEGADGRVKVGAAKKSHWLNGKLPFGLKKQDVLLKPFDANLLGGEDSVVYSDFEFWAETYLIPYLSSGENIGNRSIYKKTVLYIMENIEQLFKAFGKKPEDNGQCMTNMDELKFAIIMLGLHFEIESYRTLGYHAYEYHYIGISWVDRAEEEIKREAAINENDYNCNDFLKYNVSAEMRDGLKSLLAEKLEAARS